MKKTLLALALSITGAAVAQSPGGGGISSRDVAPELRTMQIRIHGKEHRVVDEDDKNEAGNNILAAAQVDASAVPGTNGIVGKGTAAATVDFTSGFYPPPLPSKLKIFLMEGTGSANTVTCSLTIYGFNQFGQAISESLGTVSEIVATEHSTSNKTTTKVYESVTRLTGTCSNTESTDRIVITGSHIIGLPMRISGVDAIKQICYSRSTTSFFVAGGATYSNKCLIGASADATGAFDNAGANNRIDVANSSIDLSTINSGLIATTGTISAGGSTGTALTTVANIFFRAPNGKR